MLIDQTPRLTLEFCMFWNPSPYPSSCQYLKPKISKLKKLKVFGTFTENFSVDIYKIWLILKKRLMAIRYSDYFFKIDCHFFLRGPSVFMGGGGGGMFKKYKWFSFWPVNRNVFNWLLQNMAHNIFFRICKIIYRILISFNFLFWPTQGYAVGAEFFLH